MKNKLFFLFVTILLFGCSQSNKISINKLEGSPEYENAKLDIQNPNNNDDEYSFSFEIDQYELGTQTLNAKENELANSSKGQHIHFIVNNGPYSAHYSDNFKKKLDKSNNVILAFLSRSYHESVKNPNAYVLTQVGDGDKIDLTSPFLFYSRPKGVYKGKDTKKLLLDFYLVNTSISPSGNKVRATIQDTEFIIDDWAPYYIEGLKKGNVSIKLELLNSKGELVDSPFNPSIRNVVLE